MRGDFSSTRIHSRKRSTAWSHPAGMVDDGFGGILFYVTVLCSKKKAETDWKGYPKRRFEGILHIECMFYVGGGQANLGLVRTERRRPAVRWGHDG